MDTKNQDKYRGMMLDGRYELVELIGSGGMAVVYKAMCHRLNRYVAVKIMRPELAKNEKFRRRFQTESQAIAKLSHPNIVGVYDVSRTDHVEYIVMELVDGITLKQYLQDHGPLDAVQAVDFSLQIALALAHAHGKGIVHRDIKPQNILVVNDGVIKVADFGIANLQSEVPDVENEAIGSVHYISPEQARGLPVDGRSDIYSLGIVMYEMLSGKLPFDGDDDRTVALKHLSAVPTPLREIAPSVPEALEKIVMKAMEASLDNRYQTADALAADLEALQKSLTGSLDRIEGNVAPLSTAGELGREDYVRRRRRAHRVSMLSGFFGVMAAILIIAVFLWNYFLSDIFVVNQRVAIPNFVGSNYETIINSKEFKGKYNFDLIYEIDPNVERGIIIGQSPDAGKSYMLTSDGIHVTLTVSTGVMLTEIPNLLNYDYREATSELEKLGFVVDKTFADSDDVAADCVMQISPSPGEKLPRGRDGLSHDQPGSQDRNGHHAVSRRQGLCHGGSRACRGAADARFRELRLQQHDPRGLCCQPDGRGRDGDPCVLQDLSADLARTRNDADTLAHAGSDAGSERRVTRMEGRIIKALSGYYYVDTGAELVTCRARGKFRLDGTSPLVGDRVRLDVSSDGTGSVREILPRRNYFIRPAVANIDLMVMLAAAVNPVTDPFLIDRVSALAAHHSCDFLLCINKADLNSGDELFSIYSASGIPVLRTSAVTGEGLPELSERLAGRVCAFTGNSGVGKSSLLNALSPELSLLTGEVSQARPRPPRRATWSFLLCRTAGTSPIRRALAPLISSRWNPSARQSCNIASRSLSRISGRAGSRTARIGTSRTAP